MKRNRPCTFVKPTENGHFSSVRDGYVDDLDKGIANCITARDYKGIGSSGFNLVLVEFKDERDNKISCQTISFSKRI